MRVRNKIKIYFPVLSLKRIKAPINCNICIKQYIKKLKYIAIMHKTVILFVILLLFYNYYFTANTQKRDFKFININNILRISLFLL